MDYSLVIAIVVAVTCAVANLAYTFTNQRRKAKKPVRFVAGLGAIYLAIIYTWAYVDNSSQIIRSGFLSRLGLITLLVLYLAEVIADWQRENQG